MAYLFGKEEKLVCIVDVPIKGGKGEELCLAYKTTMYALFVPAYFRDDGYVLAEKRSSHNFYPLPQGAELVALQESGAMPSPLPHYGIPVTDYAWGYLLWIALAIGLGMNWVGNALKARRHGSLQSNLPPSIARPELKTKTDRWLAAEAAKVLEGSEVVQHQAYGLDRDSNSTLGAMAIKAMYVVLTDRRLLVIHARLGAFGPLRENRGLKDYPRSSIVQVAHEERHLSFHFQDGTKLDFFADWGERQLSNQRRFLRDVPRLVGAQQPLGMASLAPG